MKSGHKGWELHTFEIVVVVAVKQKSRTAEKQDSKEAGQGEAGEAEKLTQFPDKMDLPPLLSINHC